VAPVGPQHGSQYFFFYDKAQDGTIHKTKQFGVRYVPLTDLRSQLGTADLLINHHACYSNSSKDRERTCVVPFMADLFKQIENGGKVPSLSCH
jgi:hypothetical protein